MLFKLSVQEHQEEMKLLGVLCLLAAAVALPTQEQLHTNLPAVPSPSELKSEEKGKGSDEQDSGAEQNPQELSKPEVEGSDDAKNPSESAETPKAEKEENKDKPDDVVKVIQKDSKESKKSKDSKEKPKESKESKESKEPWESKEFVEPKEEKKDSTPDEPKKGHEEEPVIVQVVHRPYLTNWFNWSHWFPNFHAPSWPFSFPKFRSGDQREDQPFYIVRESDFDDLD